MLSNNETSGPVSNKDITTNEALKRRKTDRITDLTDDVFDIVQGVLIRDAASTTANYGLGTIADLYFDQPRKVSDSEA